MTDWIPVQKTLRYEVRRVTDLQSDPDCKGAFRNGHGGIDSEPHEACGQIPIYVLRDNPQTEIEQGDWIQRWAGQKYWTWRAFEDKIRSEFPEVAAHGTQEAQMFTCAGCSELVHLVAGEWRRYGREDKTAACRDGGGAHRVGTQEAPAEAQEDHIAHSHEMVTQPTRSAAERERTWVPVYVERAICDLIPDEIGREIARDGWGWDDKHPDCRNALNRWKNEAIRQRVELIAFKALTGHELEAKHDAR